MNKKITILSLLFVAIVALSSCMKTPMACCDMPATANVGQSISFSSACSMDASSFEWDFGDGTKSTDAAATHVYSSKGTYTVKLMAMSKDGKKMNETTKSIQIN